MYIPSTACCIPAISPAMAKGGTSAKQPPSRMANAWRLYDAGDIASARLEAKEALRAPSSNQEMVQAQELVWRAGIPRLGLAMVAITAVLLLMMIALAAARG